MIHALAAALAYAAPQSWPYPSRPPGARLFSETGVLTSYSLGNHNGGMTIRRADGWPDHFFLALPNKINGRRYACQMLPSAAVPDSGCRVHTTVFVGRTRVRVWYWRAVFEDRPAKITDEIDTVK